MQQTLIDVMRTCTCREFLQIRTVLLLPALGGFGVGCSIGPSLARLDISQIAIQRLGGSFCSDRPALRELVLPSALREIGHHFLCKSSSVERVDLWRTAVERLGAWFCSRFERPRELVWPCTLREIGDGFLFKSSSVQRADLSGTAVERLGAWFCGRCEKLRELVLPSTLREIGEDFLYGSSSVERIDLSGTAAWSLGRSFCVGCRNLRELLLPWALAFLDPEPCMGVSLTVLFLPVSSGMGLASVHSASIMSGLVGFGDVPARPLLPAK
jgi:hypothetical protein